MPAPHNTAIRTYLDLLSQPKKKGRKPAGLDQTRAKLEAVSLALEGAKGIEYLHLYQRKLDLEARLKELWRPAIDPQQAEAAFIEHVAEWAKAKNVSYAALRSAGVSAQVLRRAGMKP